MTQWQTQLDQIRRDHRTPLAIAGLFAILLLWAMNNLIDTFKTHHTAITAAKSIVTPMHLQPLAKLHLFGVYAANLDDLPTTQLQLTLEGTIVIPDMPAQSRALIASPSAPAEVYQVGNSVPGNASVTRIAKHYVVLDYNGTLEKLALPIQTLTTGE